MYQLLHQRLRQLQISHITNFLQQSLVGIEREALRITPTGNIALTPHPEILGAALTHPHITTDYSEALIELITPPQPNGNAVIQSLAELHRFVHQHLPAEYLWAASMPGVLTGETSIPIASYGSSNAGRMKTIYRRGLGLRYGRNMQAIAGIHFNYSLSNEYWSILHELEAKHQLIQEYTANEYMGMIRNIQRYGWLIPYLFGASPVVAQSFIDTRSHDLQPFTANTLYYPYATSLRMGNIGYQNSLEEGKGFRANYDSLNSYTRSLTWAMETTCPDYEKIGIIDNDGDYQQLNANLLQIENEHYSTIRPKQILKWLEKPTVALRERGIHYVELRSLDVNIFEPIGVALEQLYMLEILLLLCLWHSSPRITAAEGKEINTNQVLVAHRGRDLNLRLNRDNTPIYMREWAHELITEMNPIAALLEENIVTKPYTRTLAMAKERIAHPDTTPSAIMLEMMSNGNYSFLEFGLQLSMAHQAKILTTAPLPAERYNYFTQLATTSHHRQRELELNNTQPFAQFLKDYFKQDLTP